MDELERNKSIADRLVKHDVISKEDLDKAREREKATGTPWYRQLLQTNKLSFGAIEDVLKKEFHSKSKRSEHVNLGKRLVEIKAITQDQLDEALALQERNGRLLGNILLDKGIVTRRTIAIALAQQYGLQFADFEKTPSAPQALERVPENLARKYGMIPIAIDNDRLSVLIVDPHMTERLQDCGIILGLRVDAMLTAVEDLKTELDARYGGASKGSGLLGRARRRAKVESSAIHLNKPHEEPPPQSRAAPKGEAAKVEKASTGKTKKEEKNVAKKREDSPKAAADEKRFAEIAKEAAGAPVVKLVSTIIQGAANSGATDIHLDPQEPEMRVRYRIDGILHDVMSIPSEIESAVLSRIKIMADMDITETRRPQDGHISLEIGGVEFDVRVATLPCYLGERVVLRMLDQSAVLQGVGDLGLEPEDEATLLRVLEQPYGMILVTGPTGSGKTTTLYAALNQKDVMTQSIVTLEDPVEYQLSGINQVQIDADIELGFAQTLRASMRQDIDVLLVGEIRDAETARIAIRAAMTGHLVFSTLHTNDAPEAISTLRNMGVPSFLISSALTCVIGQRLVRKVCTNCKKTFTPSAALLKSVGLPTTTKNLARGGGCPECHHTGNRGRTGIFEILEVTPDVRKKIIDDVSTDTITKAVKLKTMAERCRQKVKKGDVDPEEFLRVIRT